MNTSTSTPARLHRSAWLAAHLATATCAVLGAIDLKKQIATWRNSSPDELCSLVLSGQGRLTPAVTIAATTWCVILCVSVFMLVRQPSVSAVSLLKLLLTIALGPALLELYWQVAIKPWRIPLCVENLGGSLDGGFRNSVLLQATLQWLALVLCEFFLSSANPFSQRMRSSNSESSQ